MKFKLDSAGMEAVLNSGPVVNALTSAAMAAASAAESAYPDPHSDGPVDVDVQQYTAQGGRLKGKRPGFSLVAKHPAALGYEAKHGVLVKAARGAGLEVTSR